MSSTEGEARPRVEWMAVLDRIEATLGQSLARLEAPPPAPCPSADPDPSPLRVLDERLARLGACLEQSQQNAAEADALLVAQADTLRQWTEAMAAARKRLGDWVAQLPR